MKKPLSKLERVPLREACKHEANDFTPWLADALSLPCPELVDIEPQAPAPFDHVKKTRDFLHDKTLMLKT